MPFELWIGPQILLDGFQQRKFRLGDMRPVYDMQNGVLGAQPDDPVYEVAINLAYEGAKLGPVGAAVVASDLARNHLNLPSERPNYQVKPREFHRIQKFEGREQTFRSVEELFRALVFPGSSPV